MAVSVTVTTDSYNNYGEIIAAVMSALQQNSDPAGAHQYYVDYLAATPGAGEDQSQIARRIAIDNGYATFSNRVFVRSFAVSVGHRFSLAGSITCGNILASGGETASIGLYLIGNENVWTNPSNITANDSTSADCDSTGGKPSQILRANFTGLSGRFASGLKVTSLKVNFHMKSVTSTGGFRYRVYNSVNPGATDSGINWNSIGVVQTLYTDSGGVEQVGYGWSPDDLQYLVADLYCYSARITNVDYVFMTLTLAF